ncbi:unnamed protein product [Hermetia illucens]|uniref:Ciliary microtubule inner protein 2A-C-like domain-containing protein n=1 Tax=Hermetia illucens TaxID=343691 RepID=A0A7R8U9Z8_HERIL|nr:uncharacterized protein LOC119661150 [Hermetia illucens]CAD7076896.1 unnamed protein product [Hermetia illucens]
MRPRVYPPQPHYIPGYTGHCPKYDLIQNKQGRPHQRYLECKPAQLEKVKNEDHLDEKEHGLTLKEIDFVVAHEREPNYTHRSAPKAEEFSSFLNNQLGSKLSSQFQESVASRQKQIRDELLEERLAKRIETLNKSSSVVKPKQCNVDLSCHRRIYKTRDMFKEFKVSEATPDERKIELELCKYQPGSPNDAFAKERSAIFDIYKKDSGLIPNYAGHVPGSDFRFGKTFGYDSFNAKQWLRKS